MNASPLNGTLELRDVVTERTKKSDGIILYALGGYFLFGIFLAFFYDTFVIAIGSGGVCLAVYFAIKALVPGKLYQYVLSGILAVFTAQFIYQMHGMFEMHFFVFIGSTLLITYQNWRLQLPLILLVVLHHASFAYLQYLGNKEIYFTQLEYMDLETFMFHGALAALIVGICGYWAYDLEQKTKTETNQKLALESKLKSIDASIAFAGEISSGNFGVDYKLHDEQDELGKALLRMRENLVTASEKDQLEKFINTGISKVGEVISRNSNSLQNLADEFIKTVVKHIGVNQGGLFLLERTDEEQFLNLASCYAFDRKKFLSKKLEIGEGLVGQCFLEKELIYMTEVPQNYTRITSGLGEATPTCIIIVPVMTREEIVGVLELASFIAVDRARLDFLKKVCENMAASIISTRTTEKIKKLLEESQQQTEMMRAQEEEMRQNMEELMATQEEMRRREQMLKQEAEQQREAENAGL